MQLVVDQMSCPGVDCEERLDDENALGWRIDTCVDCDKQLLVCLSCVERSRYEGDGLSCASSRELW